MLVLSRRESEKILVPELGITLEVISIKGNTVKIGIDAPREIRVLRGEVLDKELSRGLTNDKKCASVRSSSQTNSKPLLAYARKRQGETVTANDPTVREARTGYQVCT